MIKQAIAVRDFVKAAELARVAIAEIPARDAARRSFEKLLAEALLRNHEDMAALEILTAQAPAERGDSSNARIALILARNGREEESAKMMSPDFLPISDRYSEYEPRTDTREGLIT
jgi:hypothetical protein